MLTTRARRYTVVRGGGGAAAAKHQLVPLAHAEQTALMLAETVPASEGIALHVRKQVFQNMLHDWCVDPSRMANKQTEISSGKSGTVFNMMCSVPRKNGRKRRRRSGGGQGKARAGMAACVYVGKHIRGIAKEWIPVLNNTASSPLREMYMQNCVAALGLAVPCLAYLQCGTSHTNGLVVMERFPPGQVLDKWMQANRGNTKARASVQQKLCKAILGMHSLNIVHGDLHPENIYVCTDGRVLLLDFGRSVQLSDTDFVRHGVMWDILMMMDQYDVKQWTSPSFFTTLLRHAARRGKVTLGTAQQTRFKEVMLDYLRMNPRSVVKPSHAEQVARSNFFYRVAAMVKTLQPSQRASMREVREGEMRLHAFV